MRSIIHTHLKISVVANLRRPHNTVVTNVVACRVVSCPGKVLIAGGYLITQEGLPGLVLSTTARFYSTASIVPASVNELDSALEKAIAALDWATIATLATSHPSSGAGPISVRVISPQFHTQWEYTISPSGAEALRVAPVDAGHRNTYVEWAINTSLIAASAYITAATLASAVSVLASHGCHLRVLLQADNDFYSQRAHLEDAGLPVTTENLAALPRFNPCPLDPSSGKAVINKTGLGSSAALVTSVVGATLSILGIADLGDSSNGAVGARAKAAVHDRAASQRLVHDVAQTAHCLAQGKVGSGFDVCSACYGSVRYVRVPPDALEGVMNAVRAALAQQSGVPADDAGATVSAGWLGAGRALRAVGDAAYAREQFSSGGLGAGSLGEAVRGWKLDIVSTADLLSASASTDAP